jgi:hypothetical protein
LSIVGAICSGAPAVKTATSTPRTGGVLKCLEVRRFGDERVRQDCDTPRAGHGLHEDFLPLAIEFGREKADAGGIAARTGERAHETRGDHIRAGQADDGNRVGRFLHCPYRLILEAKDNVRGGLGHRRRDCRKLILPKTKATGNDLQIVPLNEAQPLEFVKKRYDPWYLTGRARYHAESVDASRLLRSRDRHQKQRHCRRTSDERDAFAPPHRPPSLQDHTLSHR